VPEADVDTVHREPLAQRHLQQRGVVGLDPCDLDPGYEECPATVVEKPLPRSAGDPCKIGAGPAGRQVRHSACVPILGWWLTVPHANTGPPVADGPTRVDRGVHYGFGSGTSRLPSHAGTG
jgi:hypothetical protein